MTREELMQRLIALAEEIGDMEPQAVKGILYLLLSAMDIGLEDPLLLAMLPIQRGLLDLAEQAYIRMN